MQMKWNPIVNGDLSEVPQNEEFLFTIFDERHNETYVTTGWILEDEGESEVRGVDPWGWGLNSNETKNVKAWMELPEPFKPGRCSVCKHWEQGVDNFGDHWAICHLLDKVPFSQIISLKGCPLEEGVD